MRIRSPQTEYWIQQTDVFEIGCEDTVIIRGTCEVFRRIFEIFIAQNAGTLKDTSLSNCHGAAAHVMTGRNLTIGLGNIEGIETSIEQLKVTLPCQSPFQIFWRLRMSSWAYHSQIVLGKDEEQGDIIIYEQSSQSEPHKICVLKESPKGRLFIAS
jgi:hypothetical protein